MGALGIMPYISATIIIQLLSAVIPGLNKLAREEGAGQRSWPMVVTSRFCSALGRGFVMALGWQNPESTLPRFYRQPSIGGESLGLSDSNDHHSHDGNPAAYGSANKLPSVVWAMASR